MSDEDDAISEGDDAISEGGQGGERISIAPRVVLGENFVNKSSTTKQKQAALDKENNYLKNYLRSALRRGMVATVAITNLLGEAPNQISSSYEASVLMDPVKYDYSKRLHAGEATIFCNQGEIRTRLGGRVERLRKILRDMEFMFNQPLPPVPNAASVSEMTVKQCETRLREYYEVGFYVSRAVVNYLSSKSAVIQEPLLPPGSRYLDAFANSPGAVIPPFDQISPICWALLNCNGVYEQKLAPPNVTAFRHRKKNKGNVVIGDAAAAAVVIDSAIGVVDTSTGVGATKGGGRGGVKAKRNKVSFLFIFLRSRYINYFFFSVFF